MVASVHTINGTAFTGGDLAAKTGVRIVATGETSRTTWFDLKNDDRDEGQEQFQLQVNVVATMQ